MVDEFYLDDVDVQLRFDLNGAWEPVFIYFVKKKCILSNRTKHFGTEIKDATVH